MKLFEEIEQWSYMVFLTAQHTRTLLTCVWHV